MRTPLAVGTVAMLLLAGCTGTPGPEAGDPDLDLIVPGAWRVSAAQDWSMAWFHNSGNQSVNGTWSLTGAGGGPLPAGWKASFMPSSATVLPNGTGRERPGGPYRDWTSTMASLEVPNGTTGEHDLELRFAGHVRPIKVTVAPFVQVSKAGDEVDVVYEGRFHDNGELFDDGTFPTKLASGRTVPGFDNGLIGLAKDEEVTLSVPFAFAYGDDNRDPGYVKFNGRTLDFKVRLSSLPGPPKVYPGDLACKPFDDVRDPRAPFDAQDKVRVVFETTLGNFTVETDAEHAPKTVANFLQYVDEGFYACTTFHRIAPNFVLQAGGYRSDHATHKPTRDPIPLEATAQERNVRWSLSMARQQDPDTATSEFFVNLRNNTALDPSGPGTGYAVFAHVVDGFATLEAMLDVPEGKSFGRAGGYYPAEPIIIVKARRA